MWYHIALPIQEQSMWCHFHYFRCSIWQDCGRLKVLPMCFLSLRTSTRVRLLICLLSFALCADWSLWSEDWSLLCVWCKCCLRVLWLCVCECTSTGVIVQNIKVQQKVGFLLSSFPCNTMQVDNRRRLSHRHYPLRFTVSFSYMSTAHIPPVTPLKMWTSGLSAWPSV